MCFRKPFFLLLLFGINANISVNANPLNEWHNWKADYQATITGQGGWLSLAGLYWLEAGRNTLGSDPLNKHRFPRNAPPQVGVITVTDNQLQFQSFLDNTFIRDQRITHSSLSTTEPNHVKFGQFEFYIIQREQKYAIRLIDNSLPGKSNFKGVRFMPFNENAIIKGKLEHHKTAQFINVATVYGATRREKSAGWLEFEIEGVRQKLEAVDYGDDFPLYVFFSDKTSGESTYAAGRYLEVEQPDKNGNLHIDFNRAYNPPCAYTPYATCPLTPSQNRLKVAIQAGELDNHAR